MLEHSQVIDVYTTQTSITGGRNAWRKINLVGRKIWLLVSLHDQFLESWWWCKTEHQRGLECVRAKLIIPWEQESEITECKEQQARQSSDKCLSVSIETNPLTRPRLLRFPSPANNAPNYGCICGELYSQSERIHDSISSQKPHLWTLLA